MTRRRLVLGAAAAALLALALAAVATGDRRTFFDPRGDGGEPGFDIVKLTQGHDRGRLVHKLTVAGPFEDGTPELWIRVGKGKRADFVVSGAGVFRAGTFRRTGNVGFTMVDEDTLRYRFRPAAINRPRKYEWRAVGAGSPPIDRAPSRWALHQLR